MDNPTEKEVLIVKQLHEWQQLTVPTISIEARTYEDMFSFLPPRNMVVEGSKIHFYIVDREKAIEETKAHYRLFNGSQKHRDSV